MVFVVVLKRKTAYEMRISDWSSDVCSSDLQEEQVADALAQGARLLCGGGRHSLGPLFYEPTVLAGVPDKAKIMCEETFGPVAALTPFDDQAAVVRPAHATDYGLVPTLNPRAPATTHTRRAPCRDRVCE